MSCFWGPKHQYQRQTETSAEKTTSNLVKWPFINKQNSTWSNSPCSLCDCKCMIHLHIIHIICTPINLIERKLNALSTIIQNLKPNTQRHGIDILTRLAMWYLPRQNKGTVTLALICSLFVSINWTSFQHMKFRSWRPLWSHLKKIYCRWLIGVLVICYSDSIVEGM